METAPTVIGAYPTNTALHVEDMVKLLDTIVAKLVPSTQTLPLCPKREPTTNDVLLSELLAI